MSYNLCDPDFYRIVEEEDVIIDDECQHCCGTPTKVTQFYKVISSLSARYKIGLTATPKRADGLEQSMFALLGNTICEISRDEVKNTTCPIEVIPTETHYQPNYDNVLMGDGTINYARFTDSETNITYYRWQKTESIRVFLHYPLMVIDKDDERKFVFIAIPNQVRLKFDTTTKQVKDLLAKDKFTTSEWYTYDYQHSYEEDLETYKNYYINNFNGRTENNEFFFDYLGYSYKIDFNENNFVISFVK